MPQLVFLTLFLGLSSGKATVSLQADASIATIRLELDSRVVATIDHAPWSADVDFGPELMPQRLAAVGFDARGKEIARASQDVNLPRDVAEVEILVKSEKGHPSRAALIASSRKHAEPAEAQLSLDGNRLPLGTDFSAPLPATDWSRPHVLTAGMTFRDGETARGETIVSGGIGQTVTSDLTPVLVTRSRRGDPKSLDGCFTIDGAEIRGNSLEQGNPLVIIVKNPGSKSPWRFPSDREYPLDPDTSSRILWVIPQQYTAKDEPTYSLFAPTSDFSATRFGVGWLLTRSLKPVPDGPRQFADAVGVAGLAAYQSGRRRAVVLLLDNTSDLSLHSPAVIQRYLARLGVPLFVWSIGKLSPRGWGNVVDITSRASLATAVDAVKDALKAQSVVWVAADPLATLRIQGNDRCGLKPLAAPVTKPDENRRPAS
jgi:hypothetical protein